jgi:hypothetical protein
MPQYLNPSANDPREIAAATALAPVAGSDSAVAWSAIFAGAVAAAALSMVLLLLGTGFGLSSISPWSAQAAGATAIGAATFAWLTITQLAASGLGGYLAGRLRRRWTSVHSDEVYFRDTAHGFLAWCIATLLMASLLASAVGAVLGAGTRVGAAAVGGAATEAVGAATTAATGAATGSGASGPVSYYVDSLFRRDAGAQAQGGTAVGTPGSTMPAAPSASPAEPLPAATTTEVARIFTTALSAGSLPPDDAKHVAYLIAQRTGISQQDAEKRVNDTFAKTQAAIDEAKLKATQAADAARKASAFTALWLVVSLLVGAFVASFAAIYGGRRRDL